MNRTGTLFKRSMGPRFWLRPSLSAILAVGMLAMIAFPSMAEASHWRGGTMFHEVDENGVLEITMESLYRTGTASSHNLTNHVSGATFQEMEQLGVYNEEYYDVIRERFTYQINDPGQYSESNPFEADVLWTLCCWVAGVSNLSGQITAGLENRIVWNGPGTKGGSPRVDSEVVTLAPRHSDPDEQVSFESYLNAVEPNGLGMSYEFITAEDSSYAPTYNAPGISIHSTTGLISVPGENIQTWQLNASGNQYADKVYKVRVTSTSGAISERDILVGIAETDNRPPTVDAGGSRSVRFGEVLNVTVNGSDPDGDNVRLTAAGLPEGATFTAPDSPEFEPTGTFTFEPTEDQVGDAILIAFTARDDGDPNLSANTQLEVTVLGNNLPPEIAFVGNQSHHDVAAGENLTFSVTASDPNPQDTLTFSYEFFRDDQAQDLDVPITMDPEVGEVTQFSWEPTVDDIGIHRLRVRVDDDGEPSLHDAQDIFISVGDVNQSPTLDALPNSVTVREEENVAFAIRAVDPNEDDVVTISSNNMPSSATLSPIVDGSNIAESQFSWTPGAGEAGTYSVTFRATDDGSPELTEARSVEIVVVEPGGPPRINQVTPSQADKASEAVITIRGSNFLEDVDVDLLGFTEGEAERSCADVIVNSDATELTCVLPDASDVTSDDFLVDIRVTSTRDDGGVVDVQEATRVEGFRFIGNSAPIANDQSVHTSEGSARTFGLSAVDPDGGALTFTLTNPPSFGTVTFSDSDGTATYTPDDGFFGTDSFDYVANDGELDSNEATVSIGVAKITLPPEAENGVAEVMQDDSVDIDLEVSDREINDLDDLDIVIVTAPENGTLSTPDGRQVTYTPDPGFHGADSFEFRVINRETGLESNEAQVTIEVQQLAMLSLSAELTDHEDLDGTSMITRGDILSFAATVYNDEGGDVDDLQVTNSLGLAMVSDDCMSTTLSAGDFCTVTWEKVVDYDDGRAGQIGIGFEATSGVAQEDVSDEMTVIVDTDISIQAPAITGTSTPTLTGSASLDEGAEVHIEVIDSNNNSQTFIEAIDADENYSVTITDELAEGGYYAVVTFVNDAGNTYMDSTLGTIDLMPPGLTVTGPSGYISESLPTVHGSSSPGADIAIDTDNQTITTTASITGYWEWQTVDPLADGSYSWDVTATNAAGNTAMAVADFTVMTVDPVAEIDSPTEGYVSADPQLTISGSAQADTTAVLHINGEEVVTMSIDADESWDYAPSSDLPEGANQAFLVVTDLAGNTYQTPTRTFHIDTVDPIGSIVEPVDGLVTADPQPDIHGTAEPGTTVEVFVDGESIGTVTTGATGQWSAELPDALEEGVYEVNAIITDEAGNQTSTDTVGFEIDFTSPFVAITSPEDNAVMNITPDFFAGQAEEDAEVVLMVNGAEVAIVTADDNGEWEYELTGQMPLGEYELRATATDEAGNSAETTHTFTIVDGVLIVSPGQGDIIRTAMPTLSGTGEPGDTIEIVVDGEVVGTAEVDENRFWEWTADEEIEDGNYVFTAHGAGDTSDSVEVVIDTVRTDLVIMTPADSALLATPTPTVTGSSPVAADITLFVDSEIWATVTADANGQWEWTTDELEDGSRVLRAETLDEAGFLTHDTISVVIDTRPPNLTVTSPQDGETVGMGWEVTGNAEPGAELVVYVDDEPLGSTVVDDNGSWIIPGDDDLEIGEYTLRTTATDEAGNTSVDERIVDIGETMERLQSSIAGGPAACSASGSTPGGTLLVVLMGLLVLGLRRRSTSSSLSQAAVVMALSFAFVAVVAAPGVAHAEDGGVDSQQFHPMPNMGNNLFTTSSATVSPHLEFSGSLAFNYANKPLVLLDGDGENIDSLVAGLGTTNLMFTMGLLDFMELGVDLPLVTWQSGTAIPGSDTFSGDASFGIGDVRLVPKVNVLNTRSHSTDTGVALAILIDAHLPTGSSQHFQGGDFRIGPRLAFDAVVAEDFLIAANVGYRYQDGRTYENLTIDDRVGFNAGLEYSLNDQIRLTGELFGSVTPAADELFGAESHMEAMAGGKYHLGSLFFTAGAGVGILDGYGTPTWRTLLAVGHRSGAPLGEETIATTPEPEPEPEPEFVPECGMDDDCLSVPDPVCEDGVLMEYHGQCNDGVCQSEASATRCGEHEACGTDDDGNSACLFVAQCSEGADCTDLPSPTCTDGVLTEYAGLCEEGLCEHESTQRSCGEDEICGYDGGQRACVEDRGATIDEEYTRIELSQSVHFETASATISDDSFDLLNEVVQILEDHPRILAVRIEGHTDTWGERDFNLRLSQQRAESVVTYLVEKGIDSGRLTAVGVGPDEPIADNTTEEGRAENRRVEIEITEIEEVDLDD